MQASKTATDGSSAMAPPEVLGVLGERFHCGLLGLDPRLQCKYVLELCAAMLADIPERQVADVHAMNDQWSGNSQDVSRVVWTELLILGEDSDTFPQEEVTECGLEQSCGLWWKLHNLILARLASDPDLNLIALAELAKGLGRLAIPVREFDELQHMGGHGRFLSKPNIGLRGPNCNI